MVFLPLTLANPGELVVVKSAHSYGPVALGTNLIIISSEERGGVLKRVRITRLHWVLILDFLALPSCDEKAGIIKCVKPLQYQNCIF